jgi:hypothetical protein
MSTRKYIVTTISEYDLGLEKQGSRWVLRDEPEQRYQINMELEFDHIQAAIMDEITHLKTTETALSQREYDNLRQLVEVLIRVHVAAKREQNVA